MSKDVKGVDMLQFLHMHPRLQKAFSYVNSHRIAAVGLVALVLAVAAVAVFRPFSPYGRGERFQIGAAHKDDYFKLTPEKQDALGVSSDTAFVLTSKEPVPTRVLTENLKVEPAVEIDIQEVGPAEWKIVPKAALAANEIVSSRVPDAADALS